jgi:hypothetical protein
VKLVDGLRLYGEGQRAPNVNALALEGGADSRLGVGLAMDFGRSGGAVGPLRQLSRHGRQRRQRRRRACTSRPSAGPS